MDKQILRNLQYTPQARDAMAATGPPDTLVGVSRSSSPQGIDESSPSLRRRHLTKRPSQRRRRRSSGLTGASADSFRCGALLHLGCILCVQSNSHLCCFRTASRTSSPMHHLPVAIIVSSAGHSAALEPLAGTVSAHNETERGGSSTRCVFLGCCWDAAHCVFVSALLLTIVLLLLPLLQVSQHTSCPRRELQKTHRCDGGGT